MTIKYNIPINFQIFITNKNLPTTLLYKYSPSTKTKSYQLLLPKIYLNYHTKISLSHKINIQLTTLTNSYVSYIPQRFKNNPYLILTYNSLHIAKKNLLIPSQKLLNLYF